MFSSDRFHPSVEGYARAAAVMLILITFTVLLPAFLIIVLEMTQ